MFLNEYLFLKGRNLTFQTSSSDGQSKRAFLNKFVGAFEVIAFYTFRLRKFYVKR